MMTISNIEKILARKNVVVSPIVFCNCVVLRAHAMN